MKLAFFLIFLFLNCFSFGEKQSPEETKARSYLNLYRNNGSFSYLEKSCTVFAKIDHTKGLIECKLEKGFYFIKSNEFEKAQKELQSGTDFSLTTKTPDYLSSFYYGMGLIQFYKENYRSSFAFLDKAMENKPKEREKLEILSFRGFLNAKQGKYSPAKKDLLESKKSDNPKVRSKSLMVLAEIERKENNLDISEKYALSAAKIDKENSHINLLIYDYEFLELLYKQKGDSQNEKLYREKIKILSEELGTENSTKGKVKKK